MNDRSMSYHSSQNENNQPLLDFQEQDTPDVNSFNQENNQQQPANEFENNFENEQVLSENKDNQVHEQDTTSENTFQETFALRLNFQNKLESFMNTLNKELGYTQKERKSNSSPFDDEHNDQLDSPGFNQKYSNKLQEFLQIQENAPKDAQGCTNIQSLKEYIQSSSQWVRNPRNAFYDLSCQYYNSKYDDKDNEKTIEVKSYLQTDPPENFIKNLSMDIITTNQGCMPIIKTFEWNAYNKHTQNKQNIYNKQKYIKALKFYDYRGDCKRIQQFIVDEGIMEDDFRTYDTSILMYGNSIIFFKREESWHKLCVYDVVKNQLEEIDEYKICEPIQDEIRYHLIFSQKFGDQKSGQMNQSKQKSSIHEFLKDQFVFCQSYKVNEKMEFKFINLQIVMFSLANPKKAIPSIRGKIEPFQEAIQYICHIQDPQTNRITFIAIDPFSSHQFYYDPKQLYYSDFTTFTGNNEVQMQQIEALIDEESEYKHKYLSPFYKHHNEQFLIQKNKVILNIVEKNQEVDQYYYITNDNQFMLIYPNYLNLEQKNQVILQIAKKHSHNQNPDYDYSYQDDFEQRQKQYQTSEYKKISHICSDEYRSKNHMKRSSHLKMIINQKRDFNILDKIILSTDQERSNIYVFQQFLEPSGQEETTKLLYNTIKIYSYENNIDYSRKIQTLPKIIQELNIDEEHYYDKTQKYDDQSTFYINSQFKNVVSSQQIIKTFLKDEMDPTGHFNFKLDKTQNDEFVLIEGKNGIFFNVRVKQKQSDLQNINLQLYYKSKQYYLFVFLISNLEDEELDAKHYFFVRKSINEINYLCSDNAESILLNNQDVYVIQENDQIGYEKDILQKYVKIMKLNDLVYSLIRSDQQNIKLSFEPIFDNKYAVEFLPFIYQDKQSILNHHLLVFDINSMRISSRISIAPNVNLRQRIRKQEFVQYSITRTSDIFEQKLAHQLCRRSTAGNNSQLVKYQVGIQFYLNNVDIENQEESQRNPANCTYELSEYVINYQGGNNSKVQLIGRKQLMLSDEAQAKRSITFDKIMILPYFDRQGHVKGSQLILKEDGQAIHILDQDLNNIYHQNSEIIQFGHQKFLTNEDNHQEYIMVISSQIKQQIYLNGNLEQSEAYYILSKAQKKLLSMQLAKFEYFVLHDDFDSLMKDEFYQAQEVLEGKTLCDLCLSFPKEILNGLKQTPQQYQKLEGSLIDEISQNVQENIDFYQHIGLCEKNLIVQLDFNFISTLRIAIELNQNQSAKMLLKKIFEIDSKDYKDIFMIDLPIFLKQNLIDRIFPFFEIDRKESVAIERDLKNMYQSQYKHSEFCNFEDFISLPELPTFSDKRVQYHIKSKYVDFHNQEEEVIYNVSYKDPLKIRGIHSMFDDSKQTDEQKNFEVQHSIIDLEKLVIGEKIRAYQKGIFKDVEFNDQSLADLLNLEKDEHSEFFNLQTVRKLIDFQFTCTKQFLEGMLKFYSLGFVIPFILSISVDMLFVKNITFILCFFTQSFFFIFEIRQIMRQRLQYFKDIWNVVDSSQFICFLILFFKQMTSQFQSDSFMEMLLKSFLITLSIFKIIYFVRIYDQFCIFLTLQTKIAGDLGPFLGIVVFVMVAVTKIQQILHAAVNDPSNEYADINNEFVKSMLQTYKGMGGEKISPKIDDSMSERLQDNDFGLISIFGIIVIVWLCQQGFFSLIFTFFISLVSQSYEKHLQKIQLYHYRIKAQLNVENYQILDLFVKQRNYKAIFMSIDKNLLKNECNTWLGPSNAFKMMMEAQKNAAEDAKRANDEQAAQLAQQADNRIQSLNKIHKEATQNLQNLQRINEQVSSNQLEQY